MNDIFTQIKEYREGVLDVLKQNKTYYDTIPAEYSTPSKKYNIRYCKWKHPYQGDWETFAIFTDEILDGLREIITPDSVVIDVGAQSGIMSDAYAQFAKKEVAFEPNPVT